MFVETPKRAMMNEKERLEHDLDYHQKQIDIMSQGVSFYGENPITYHLRMVKLISERLSSF